MIQLNRSKYHKWIFQKNISSANIMQQFIAITNRMDNKAYKEVMMSELRRSGFYHGRSAVGSSNTMGVRTSQMKFYMFGYSLPSSPKSSFFLSPMAASMLKDRTSENIGKMCLVNLFSMQYPHPFSDTSSDFRIYFGRLLVKLLLDSRLGKKLYIDEACYFLPFLETINLVKYNELVESILEFRRLSFRQKDELFKQVKNYDDVFANVFHEFNYYFLRIFNGLQVLDIVGDEYYNGGRLHSFHHGNGETYRNDAYVTRGSYSGYFKIKDNLMNYASSLVEHYSPFEMPKTLADYYSEEDFILELYQRKPAAYLSIINPSMQRNQEVSEIIFNMVHMSRFGSRDGQDFEKSLKPLFELFKQAEYVEPIGGSGDTDILCTMRAGDDSLYKINVDAKTSTSSTASLNPARLTNHLRMHNSKYCIVVSPRFALGVANDIAGSKIVAITAETLASYCINEYNVSSDGFIDFSMIDEIIRKHLGFNITNIVQEFVNNYYGA